MNFQLTSKNLLLYKQVSCTLGEMLSQKHMQLYVRNLMVSVDEQIKKNIW